MELKVADNKDKTNIMMADKGNIILRDEKTFAGYKTVLQILLSFVVTILAIRILRLIFKKRNIKIARNVTTKLSRIR